MLKSNTWVCRGLTGKNVVQVLEKIISKIGVKDFCIDAEGGLRSALSKERGDDLISIDKSRKYLSKSARVLDIR